MPYKFARVQVDLHLTSRTVEVFSQNKRIASHVRVADLLKHKGRHTTISEHMPKATQARRCCCGVKNRINGMGIGLRPD